MGGESEVKGKGKVKVKERYERRKEGRGGEKEERREKRGERREERGKKREKRDTRAVQSSPVVSNFTVERCTIQYNSKEEKRCKRDLN